MNDDEEWQVVGMRGTPPESGIYESSRLGKVEAEKKARICQQIRGGRLMHRTISPWQEVMGDG